MENFIILVIVAIAGLYIVFRLKKMLSKGEDDAPCAKCAAQKMLQQKPSKV